MPPHSRHPAGSQLLSSQPPLLSPYRCCCPNCDRGLGNIFAALILYFPFPLSNIKHNFALSLSLRLRFADVSTWKPDPFACNWESSPAPQPGLGSWSFRDFRVSVDMRRGSLSSEGQMGRFLNPKPPKPPFPYDRKRKCVFDVCLVDGLFNKIPLCVHVCACVCVCVCVF